MIHNGPGSAEHASKYAQAEKSKLYSRDCHCATIRRSKVTPRIKKSLATSSGAGLLMSPAARYEYD